MQDTIHKPFHSRLLSFVGNIIIGFTGPAWGQVRGSA
jgi:hypothetical protein